MLSVLINKLRQIVKNSILIGDQKDNDVFYSASIQSFNNLTVSQIYYPYGYYAVAPKNSQGVTFSILSQEDNQVTFPYDAFTRFSGLQAGEIMLGHQIKRSYLKFTNDANIELKTPTGNMLLNVDSGTATINVNSSISVTTQSTVNVNSTGKITIQSDGDIELNSNGATLILSSSSLVSSVPISAPSFTGSGGGAAVMTAGINMSSQNITNAGDITAGGVNLTTHKHTDSEGGDTSGPQNV
ncbi:hypothetical protein [Fangia hongkongensis]|uniref:hypothetical protein n=1 Tax=Fangia hongkongensis TaxID=270495 RepID=UPI00036EBE87|nr:hypothetical protein [Fangia hongkongensis]MBK2125117.1 hypothetical protein [Fangia hongkongensis]